MLPSSYHPLLPHNDSGATKTIPSNGEGGRRCETVEVEEGETAAAALMASSVLAAAIESFSISGDDGDGGRCRQCPILRFEEK